MIYQPKEIHLFPNPINGVMQFSLSKANQVMVYNTLGRVLDRFDFDQGLQSLDLSKFG